MHRAEIWCVVRPINYAFLAAMTTGHLMCSIVTAPLFKHISSHILKKVSRRRRMLEDLKMCERRLKFGHSMTRSRGKDNQKLSECH